MMFWFLGQWLDLRDQQRIQHQEMPQIYIVKANFFIRPNSPWVEKRAEELRILDRNLVGACSGFCDELHCNKL